MRVRSSMILLTLAVVACAVWAQKRDSSKARPSPNAAVSQTVGATDVTVTYGRPAVRGREIWGKLVPYGQVWRTGANECSTITFSKDVVLEGKRLAAGAYGLFTIPGQNEWTWVFNKNAAQWGASDYKPEEDALRVTAKPHAAEHAHEWMTFAFEHLTADSATLVLHWEKLAVPLKIQEAK